MTTDRNRRPTDRRPGSTPSRTSPSSGQSYTYGGFDADADSAAGGNDTTERGSSTGDSGSAGNDSGSYSGDGSSF